MNERVQILKKTIDYHLKTLFRGKESHYNHYQSKDYYSKLIILASNEIKLHDLHNNDDENPGQYMRMVSLTQSYSMYDSQSYR